jgi:hypothetical protein
MSADRAKRQDAHGEPFEVLTGAALRFELGDTMKESVLVGLMVPNSCMVTFDEEQAVDVALLLLKAAGVDIVGAARRVKEAQEAIEAHARTGRFGKAYTALLDRRGEALDVLSAELAKLEGGA